MKRAWTTTELKRLRENRELGAVAIAELLGRSVWSVKGAAYRQGISLRRPGDVRGHVLGQPRAMSLAGDAHQAMAAAPDLYAERLRVLRDASLCPECARRPIQVERLRAGARPAAPPAEGPAAQTASRSTGTDAASHELAVLSSAIG